MVVSAVPGVKRSEERFSKAQNIALILSFEAYPEKDYRLSTGSSSVCFQAFKQIFKPVFN